MNNHWLTLACSTFCLALVSPFAQAQGSGWDASWDCPKRDAITISDSWYAIKHSTPDHPMIIADGGSFYQALPDDSYAGENTLLALQWARCQGFYAAEVDLRLTADQKVILMRDETLARTTNIDGYNGDFIPEVDAEVLVNGQVHHDDHITNPLISSLTLSDIRSSLGYSKIYNQDGRFHGFREYGNTDYILLNKVLRELTPSSGNSLEGMILILNIPDFDTYMRAIESVRSTSTWGRVIFKVPFEAIPVTVNQNGPFESVSIRYDLLDGPYNPRGSYRHNLLIKMDPETLDYVPGYAPFIHVLDTKGLSASDLRNTPTTGRVGDYVMIAMPDSNRPNVRELIIQSLRQNTTGVRLYGIEASLPLRPENQDLDNWIMAHPTLDENISSWGDVQGVDRYQRSSAFTSENFEECIALYNTPDAGCLSERSHFPEGFYFITTPHDPNNPGEATMRYENYNNEQLLERQIYGREHSHWTLEVYLNMGPIYP
ncbi:glycerophosphodiester phosphodiesterase [Woodsholea maritima]|uniref:glycerophosphodiester phosphodiesterase n=1 Tax=Woodsholea maritima TaxID=240237 RepID=UPI00039A018C|nr:glycerophosphodiester phosphodiesterase family protein [Woodsholea maritima]